MDVRRRPPNFLRHRSGGLSVEDLHNTGIGGFTQVLQPAVPLSPALVNMTNPNRPRPPSAFAIPGYPAQASTGYTHTTGSAFTAGFRPKLPQQQQQPFRPSAEAKPFIPATIQPPPPATHPAATSAGFPKPFAPAGGKPGGMNRRWQNPALAPPAANPTLPAVPAPAAAAVPSAMSVVMTPHVSSTEAHPVTVAPAAAAAPPPFLRIHAGPPLGLGRGKEPGPQRFANRTLNTGLSGSAAPLTGDIAMAEDGPTPPQPQVRPPRPIPQPFFQSQPPRPQRPLLTSHPNESAFAKPVFGAAAQSPPKPASFPPAISMPSVVMFNADLENIDGDIDLDSIDDALLEDGLRDDIDEPAKVVAQVKSSPEVKLEVKLEERSTPEETSRKETLVQDEFLGSQETAGESSTSEDAVNGEEDTGLDTEATLHEVDLQDQIPAGKSKGGQTLVGNRRQELFALRELRVPCKGLVTGTCTSMCPEFERHDRESLTNGVNFFEIMRGTSGFPTRIDHELAVKEFNRSSAGKIFFPEDVRTPDTLRVTFLLLFFLLLAFGHLILPRLFFSSSSGLAYKRLSFLWYHESA